MTGVALAPLGLAPFSADELLAIQLQLAARSKSPLQTAWIEFLQRFPMQWFCTMTFKQHVHPERADKTWRLWQHRLNMVLFGKNYFKRPGVGCFWIRALELQKREVIHYHALVGTATDIRNEQWKRTWKNEWLALAGFADITDVQSDTAVCNYVSKYVVKGGEIDVSESLRSFCQAQALEFPGR
jgi:hypothetical protein